MKLKIDKTIFAFTLIFSTFLIWSVVMTTLNQTSLSEQNKYSEVINKSGIQRMLSQKITLHIINYSRTNDISNKDEVEKLLSLFIKNKIDIEKFITTTKTETDNIYTPNKQYKDIDKFINMTSLFIKNHHEINMDEFYNYSQALLLKLDDAVSDFQNLSDLSLNEISNQQLYSEILLYIVILLEIIFIAYPIIKNRNKLVSELEELKDTIDKTVIISKTNTKGIITYVNERFEKLSGYSKEELIGKPHNIVRHPDMDKNVFKDVWKTIQSKNIWHGVIKNRHKDGGFYIVDASIVPILDEHKNIKEYLSIRHDITSIKLLEDKLNKQQNTLHFAQKIANIGHWELNLETNELYWSDEVYRIFGLEPQEFGATYEAFLNYIHPKDIDMVNEAYTKSLEDLKPYQIIHRVISKDNKIKYVEERCEHDIVDGKVIRSVGTVFDITKKVENEKKIEEYVSLIDKEVITSSTDLTGKIIYVSDAFCEISGYERDELLGKNHSIVRHPDMDSSIYKDLWETIISNKTWTGEIKNLKKDGSFYWVEAIISPSYDIKGNKVGYTSVRHDITDKKYIEEISITDGLTNIYNRRHFDGVFPKVINSAKRKNELVSFLIMDIDHFKQYNDTYGHQMGDDVLIKVASAIKNSLNRAEDICFRLGGEEFGAIFKADSKKKAEEFANTIRENIENLHIEHSGNSASSFVTASMGLICKNANDIKDVDTVYKQGDDLLYEAKESGRNRVCFRD